MIDGVLAIYKEKSFTSHDAVAKLRGILHRKRIGHTGTLDPDAEGVLPVCLGRATRLADYLSDGKKVYKACLLLGMTTDTQDVSGTVLSERPVTVSEAQVREAVMSFVGPYAQLPPMYSAKKVGGKKLYDLAREGKVIERTAVPVEIYRIDILETDLPRVVFRVECSKGTYIRTLCEDIGALLGCGGCMESLLREQAGGFGLEDTLTLSQVEALQLVGKLDAHIRTTQQLLRAYPSYVVNENFVKAAQNGNSLPYGPVSVKPMLPDVPAAKSQPAGTLVSVYQPDGSTVGLYRADPGKKCLAAEVMLNFPLEEKTREISVPPSVVTIGKFDGFHRGHRELLRVLSEIGEREGLRKAVFSFSESPKAFFSQKRQDCLHTAAEKRAAARELGVEYLIECPFTEEIRTISADDFLQKILIGAMGMKQLVVGPDCSFGRGREGNAAFLQAHAAEFGYTVTVVSKLAYLEQPISSSRIRDCLSEGDVSAAAEMLGSPYCLEGPVLRGKQLGRTIGIPTANQAIPEGKYIPKSGVYASCVIIDGERRCGVTNIGIKPTVAGERRPAAETWLPGFSGDLYGKNIKSELLAFIRPEMKFASLEALREQILRDGKAAEAYFSDLTR